MRTSEPSSSDVLMSRGRRGMVNWKVPIWLRRNVRKSFFLCGMGYFPICSRLTASWMKEICVRIARRTKKTRPLGARIALEKGCCARPTCCRHTEASLSISWRYAIYPNIHSVRLTDVPRSIGTGRSRRKCLWDRWGISSTSVTTAILAPELLARGFSISSTLRGSTT